MSKKDDGPGCGGCMFWLEGTESGDTERWGFCRRFPPTVIASPDTDEEAASVQAWAVLPHWCGEHKPRLQ
jgi:hypothetical protein